MEGLNMRRSKFRKICFLLFLILVILGGYYVYEMKIKKLYDKYSQLMQQEAEKELLALKKQASEKNQKQQQEQQQQQQQQQPVQEEDGVHRKVVNGVEFVIDQRHEEPQDGGNNQQPQNVQNPPEIQDPAQKPQEPIPPPPVHAVDDKAVDDKAVGDNIVDDNAGDDKAVADIAAADKDQDIPDDADLPLQPHGHDQQHWHEVKRLGVNGDRKIEKEVVNGVEFIVDHNGEDVPEKNSPLDSLVKDVEKKEGPLKDNVNVDDESLAKIHGLMNAYRNKLKAVQPDGANQESGQHQIAKPLVQPGDAQQPQAPPPIQEQPLNEEENKMVKKEKLMQRLGLVEPLDDSKIMKTIVSGKVSEEDAKALMQYHSINRAAQAEAAKPEAVKPEAAVANAEGQIIRAEQQKKPKDTPLNSLKVYDFNEEADLTYDCVKLKLLDNDTKICVNDPKIDKPISASLVEKGTWESQNLQEFQRALIACPQCGVLDLGSNLGVYSLTAAHYGRHVIAVEPLLENIKPFHKSVQVNGLQEKIVLLRNAVSDKRGYMEVKYPVPPNNLGAAYVEHVDYKTALKDKLNNNIVKAITLEDLKFVVNFKSVILKIDIQGSEHSVFKNSMGFFDQLDVPYIFMHWLYDEYKEATLETADFLVRKGYQPKITISGKNVGVSALTRDQHLLIWVKQYAPPQEQA